MKKYRLYRSYYFRKSALTDQERMEGRGFETKLKKQIRNSGKATETHYDLLIR